MKEETEYRADEVSLKDLILKIREYWHFLLLKWKIITVIGILGAIIGLFFAIVSKPIYTAELSFALQDDKGNGGGLNGALGLASQFGLDLGGSAGGEFAGDNLLELMKSRSMVTRALLLPVVINQKKQTLAERYIEFNHLRDKWKEESGLENLQFISNTDSSNTSLKRDSILGMFHKTLVKNNLTVDKADKKLSIITVKVNSTDELFSKKFAEALTAVVSDFYIQTKTEKAAKNVAILQKQVDSVRRILHGNLSGVASSTDINPNPNPFLSALRVPTQKKQIDVQSNTAILTQLVANLEIAKMSLLQSTPLIQIIDRPILPLEKTRVGKIRSVVMGGLLGLLLIIFYLSCKRFISQVLL